MLHRPINQDGGYSSRRLTPIDEPLSTRWAMATRLPRLVSSVNWTSIFQPIAPQFVPTEPNSRGFGHS
jgi:hypothetical protein